jgi:hypothetical protein
MLEKTDGSAETEVMVEETSSAAVRARPHSEQVLSMLEVSVQFWHTQASSSSLSVRPLEHLRGRGKAVKDLTNQFGEILYCFLKPKPIEI